jgi:hypothetical protein
MSRLVVAQISGSPLARRSGYAVIALALGACSSVLGIEELHEGSAGTAGAAASGGSDNVAGGNPSGGKGGSTAVPSEGGSTDAQAGDGPAPPGGDTGGGGAPEAVVSPVHGKVLDIWGNALGGVSVQIGETKATTNGLGEFTVEEVPAEYDVSLMVTPKGEAYGWYYAGLTRRNPTLQVYRAFDMRSAYLDIRPKNAVLTSQQDIMVALGTGANSWSTGGIGQVGADAMPSWRGGTTVSGTAHALLLTKDGGLPVSFEAYKSQTIALEVGAAQDALFEPDLTPGTLPSGTIQGTITDNADGDRMNKVFLRFTSNASMRLVREYTAPNTFSYVVPNIPSASATIAAYEGYEYGPLGIAHADGLTAGTAGIKLDIPTPPELALPEPGATGITVGSKLSYEPSPDHTGGAVIWLTNSSSRQELFIVTTKREVAIPQVLGGAFALPRNQKFTWQVETHGQFDSVDDMTGEHGFIDSFGAYGSEPHGSRMSSGTYTISAESYFVTAP